MTGETQCRCHQQGVIDGLYRVTTSYLCAGFTVEDGRVTLCAPILRKRLSYWRSVARWVAP